MSFGEWLFGPFLNGTPGDEDGQAARTFLAEMDSVLASRGVTESALLALRLEEVLSATMTVRALEEAVHGKGVVLCEEGEERSTLNPFLEPLCKAHERRRKALTELEETCGAAANPVPTNLADFMKPILKRAEGVLEESLVPGRRKIPKKV